MKQLLRFWGEAPSWFGVAVVLFSAYLLTLPMLHVTALRNIFLYSSLIAFCGSLWRREVRWPRVDNAAWLLVAYAAVAVVAIAVNQVDTAASLHRVRTELLVQLYILVFVLVYAANRASPRPILSALGGGFVLLTLFALFSLLHAWLSNVDMFAGHFHLRQLVDGYGLNAQFYLPVLAGALAAFALPPPWRTALWVVVAAAFALTVWYNATSAVVFMALCMVYVALYYLRRRYRIGVARLALFALVGAVAAVLVPKAEGVDKILQQARLAAEGRYFELLSMRGGLWAVGVECAADAPWYGYGYGQRKVARVCGQESYLAPARERGNPMADYFRQSDPGKVSLHNQYLENWVLAGWIGALLWLGFFLGACRSAWRKRGPDGFQQLVVLPALVIFLAGCFFNGLWEGGPWSKAIMVILGLALVERRLPA
jgi:O-antigen ligase